MKHVTFPETGERSAQECLYWFPTIAKTATNTWAQSFAHSVMAQSRRRGWKPTPKQLAMMRKLVAEFFRSVRNDDGEDFSLIE
jgi:hypothetical protein